MNRKQLEEKSKEELIELLLEFYLNDNITKAQNRLLHANLGRIANNTGGQYTIDSLKCFIKKSITRAGILHMWNQFINPKTGEPSDQFKSTRDLKKLEEVTTLLEYIFSTMYEMKLTPILGRDWDYLLEQAEIEEVKKIY